MGPLILQSPFFNKLILCKNAPVAETAAFLESVVLRTSPDLDTSFLYFRQNFKPEETFRRLWSALYTVCPTRVMSLRNQIPNEWLNLPLHLYLLDEKTPMTKSDLVPFFEKCLSMTAEKLPEKNDRKIPDELADDMAKNLHSENFASLKLLQYEYDIKLLRESFMRVEKEASRAKFHEMQIDLLTAKMKVKDEISEKSKTLLEQENKRVQEKLAKTSSELSQKHAENLSLSTQLRVVQEKFEEFKNIREEKVFENEKSSRVDQKKYDYCKEETFKLKDEIFALQNKISLISQEKDSQKGFFDHQICEYQKTITEITRKNQLGFQISCNYSNLVHPPSPYKDTKKNFKLLFYDMR